MSEFGRRNDTKNRLPVSDGKPFLSALLFLFILPNARLDHYSKIHRKIEKVTKKNKHEQNIDQKKVTNLLVVLENG